MDDRVPELIWIALLIQVCGWQEGTAVAASVAKAARKCAPSRQRAYAATSDYWDLSDEQKECIRSTVSAEGTLASLHSGLAALMYHYAEFPLAFLAQPVQANEDFRGSTLDDLREAIANVSDRQGDHGIFAQATVVYIYFINDVLKVSPNSALANFPAIEDYPHTEESLRVAAAVSSMVTGLFPWDVQHDWRNSFWNQGRLLGPCEVG